MASDYLYPKKDRMVRIYRSKQVRWRNESAQGQYMEKHYLHPRDEYVRAYVRQIAESNGTDQSFSMPSDRFLVAIGYRSLGEGPHYVEWQGKTLKVLSSDAYEHRGKEIKLTCQLIPKDESIYESVTDEPWEVRP